MGKNYTALGLMSGTSMDGVDASIIKSDGNSEYSIISDEYFEYNQEFYSKLINIRDKVSTKYDLKIYFNESLDAICLVKSNMILELKEKLNC